MPPRKRKATSAGAGGSDDPLPVAETLPVFDIDGTRVPTLADDPWHVIRKRESIRVYGDWWPSVTGPDKKKLWPCELVGYTDSYKWATGETAPAYIINDSGDAYAMRSKDVWKLLPIRLRPKPAVDSDDEDLNRNGVDDSNNNRGGAVRQGQQPAAGAAVRPPNAPRLGDEWADEINALVNELHGEKEEVNETVDEETGEVSTHSKRVPSGWDHPTSSKPPEKCTVPAELKLRKPIPRHHCQPGKPCTWEIVDSFRWCWPVIAMVTGGSNKYYDHHVDLNEQLDEAAKKLTVRKTSWPQRVTDEDTGHITGGITEAHYEGYLAIIFFMGMVRCRDMEWHWCLPGTHNFHHNFVRRIMSFDMFVLMRRFLHYSDPATKVPRGDWKPAASGKAWVPPPDGYDMIHNFRPIMDACNVAWIELVSRVAALTYDE